MRHYCSTPGGRSTTLSCSNLITVNTNSIRHVSFQCHHDNGGVTSTFARWLRGSAISVVHLVLYLAPPQGVIPVEFRGDLWHPKTRVAGLSCDVVCVILRLAVLVGLRLVTDGQTDRQTDGHKAMASTADAEHRAVKSELASVSQMNTANRRRWRSPCNCATSGVPRISVFGRV